MDKEADLQESDSKYNFLKTTGTFSLWKLIKIYWQSEERVRAYVSSFFILSMTIVLVGADVAITYWFNHFYNALQEYQKDWAMELLGIFCILAFASIFLQVYRYYITQKFCLRWRQWLTKQLVQRWLANKGYYYLENFDPHTDNPDQRIQEDALGLVENTVALVVGLVTAVTTFPAFVYVLWELSGVLTLNLGSLGTWHIYGYLVWVAVIYNLLGTLVVFKVGYPLVPLNFEQQRREATFRYAAIDLRSHSEHVALYRGEQHQEVILRDLFKGVLANWYQIILRQKKLMWFTGTFNQAAVLIPLLVALPNYFGKVFKLGGLMQSLRAFTSIQESLSYFVNAYTQIAQWRAIGLRLTTFITHLNEIEMRAEKANQVTINQQKQDAIVTKDVDIRMPNGELLLQNINEQFVSGKNYVIKGESGIGKSTLVRTIAGVWPFASGGIEMPSDKRIMYLPQRAYMPIGTLEEAILFPDKHDSNLVNKVEQVMRDCHLEHLIPRLQETAHWSEQLSPGEQQRVAFARVLLHKPDWVFMDESTSMLDMANETYLYNLIKERLPNCTIVSVGHHPSVDQFHDEIVDLTKFSPARA